MELTVEYIPALIVAKDKEGKYVKISEANKDEIYYCPVCNGEVKARAISSDKVQPHFYHTTESNCSNESILHWMFKNWLFESGSVFKVDEEEFVVNSFEMEKSIDTPFGEYRPDLFIQTNKEEFFFEINYSSGKDKTFSDKWTYLNKRVVEVNVKELINCELYDNTPMFKTIFENGQYTKEYKTYERKDKYLEFKNYVISANKEEQIKQLVSYYDWFWRDIKNGSDEDIKVCINEMKYDDAIVCTRFLKKIKCHDKFDVCKNEMLDRRQKLLNDILNDENYCIRINKLSPQRYTVLVYKNILGTMVGEESSIIKSIDGLFNYLDLKESVDECLEMAKKSYESVEFIVKKANEVEFNEMKSEKIITVHKVNQNVRGMCYKNDYDVNLIINVYSDYFNEWIRVYNGAYIATKEDNAKIKRAVREKILEREKKEKERIAMDEKYKSIKRDFFNFNENNFYFTFIDTRKEIILKHKTYGKIFEYDSKRLLSFDNDLFCLKISKISDVLKKIEIVVEEINNCKNGFWSAKIDIRFGCAFIEIKPKGMEWFSCENFSPYEDITEDKIRYVILKEMKKIIIGYYNYKYDYRKEYKIIKIRKEN